MLYNTFNELAFRKSINIVLLQRILSAKNETPFISDYDLSVKEKDRKYRAKKLINMFKKVC